MGHERPLRAVLVGCGSMSAHWLGIAAKTDGLEIVGLADINEDAAAKRAREFGLDGAVTAGDFRELLGKLRPDVVLDCTVPEAHFEVTTTALEAGAHVLGEKPMADSLDRARRMVEAAERAGRIYAVIQNRRYHAPIRRLRAFLDSDALGPVTYVQSDFFIGAHFGGFRDRMKHVLLLDMAIHTFDAARYITGADPVAVTCREWNPPGSWYDHDASAVAVFEMTGGVVYTYCGSWCAEGLNTTWESDWRVVCRRGSCLWDGAEGFRAQALTKTGRFISEFEDLEVPAYDGPEGKLGGHEGLIKEFLRCVRAGERPETVCTDNIKSLAMVFAAIESAETGRRVAVER